MFQNSFGRKKGYTFTDIVELVKNKKVNTLIIIQFYSLIPIFTFKGIRKSSCYAHLITRYSQLFEILLFDLLRSPSTNFFKLDFLHNLLLILSSEVD